MLGENLRDWRRARRLSQRALAERVGISTRTLALCERGARFPDDRTLHALADALNILPAALLSPRIVTKITLKRCFKFKF